MRLAILSLLVAASAVAQEESEPEQMSLEQLLEQQVVVTSSRMKTTVREAPAAVYVLSERQIRERGYRTLVEALEDMPGFDVVHVYGIYPELIHQRGLPGNNQRSLLAIDGVLDNNLFEQAILGGSIRFPLRNLSRVEVLAGPASAIYGANAFNGVMNLISKDGAEEPGADVALTLGSQPGAAIDVSLRGGSARDWQWSISASGLLNHGPSFSGVEGPGYYFSPLYDNSKEQAWYLTTRFQRRGLRFGTTSWQYRQGQGTFANGSAQIDTDENGLPASAWDFASNSAFVGYFAKLSRDFSLDSEVNGRLTDLLDRSHDSLRLNPVAGQPAYADLADVQPETGWSRRDYSLEARERLTWDPAAWSSGTLGVEAQHIDVPLDYARSNPTGARRTYDNVAAYVQEVIRPVPSLAITAGYRFDDNSNYGTSHTPRIGAVWTPREELTAKLLVGTGFRGPTAWEQFSNTETRIANPQLTPERLVSVEASLAGRISKRYYVSVNAYLNRISSLLVDDLPTTTPGINQNQNVGGARVLGLELLADARVTSWLDVYGNATFDDGEYVDLDPRFEALVGSRAAGGSANDEIPTIAPVRVNAGFTLRVPGMPVSLNVRANYAAARRVIATNPAGTVPASVVFHAHARWESLFVRGLDAELSVRNLFDAAALEPGIRAADGSYYPTRQPFEPRNLWLSLAYRL